MSFRSLHHPRRQPPALLCNPSCPALARCASRSARRRTQYALVRAAQHSTQVQQRPPNPAQVAAKLDDRDSGDLDVARFPADWQQAYRAGDIPAEVAQSYLQLASSLWGPLLTLPGFRDRLVADPSFVIKVSIEVGIGICTKTTAEFTKRGAAFSSELDFVLANVIMALLADFALVYLPAPTIRYTQNQPAADNVKEQNQLLKFLASCPENSFQKVPPGYKPFTLAQRFGAVVRNGGKLFAVGTVASLVGVGLTDAIVMARQALDPGFIPLNPPQNPAVTAILYGLYMSVSSNLRYQFVAGIVEERGIEEFIADRRICNVLSFIVRTSNTFVGSLLWLDFVRFFGLQSSGH